MGWIDGTGLGNAGTGVGKLKVGNDIEGGNEGTEGTACQTRRIVMVISAKIHQRDWTLLITGIVIMVRNIVHNL